MPPVVLTMQGCPSGVHTSRRPGAIAKHTPLVPRGVAIGRGLRCPRLTVAIVTLGIDLAKNVRRAGVDAAGTPVLLRPNVARGELMPLVTSPRQSSGGVHLRLPL